MIRQVRSRRLVISSPATSPASTSTGRSLSSSSVLHSGSGVPGETVTVAVRARNGMVRVEVANRTGPGVRKAPLPRGMRKAVAGFSSPPASRRGGVATLRRPNVTWFEIQALLQPMQHSAETSKGLYSPDVKVSGSSPWDYCGPYRLGWPPVTAMMPTTCCNWATLVLRVRS